MNIAIFGASGYIGLRLAHKYKTSKDVKKLKLFNRNKRKILHLLNDKVSAYDYDLNKTNAKKLEKDLKGIDIVYYLIHSMYEKNNFSNLDNELAQLISCAANGAGVKKIIYLGGLGVIEENNKLSEHLISRQQTADYLRREHKNVIEFRSGIIIGGGSSSFEIIRSLGTKLPFIPLLWKKEGLVEPIFVDNVLNYLMLAKKDSNYDNKILEIGCGEQVKYSEIIDIYAKKKERTLIKIPLYFLERFFPDKVLGRIISFMSSLPAPLVTPLLGGVKNKAVTQDYKLENVLGYCPIKPLSLEKSLSTACKREEEEHILSVWDLPSSMSTVKKMVHKENGSPFSTASKEIEGLLYEEEKVNFEDYIASNFTESKSIKDLKEKVFKEVKKVGGRHGYWTPSILWKSRALIDKLVGGIGFRRFRRNCEEVKCGDRIDFWTVEKITESDYYKELRLKAEMKLPGSAWLRFKILKNKDKKEEFVLQAIFDPSGIWGYAYWYSLFPIHKYIFKTMIKNILKNADINY